MGHLTLKIQTSSLFLKAKHAFSLHRKSSPSSSSSSSSTSSATTSPTSYSPTDSTVSPPLPIASNVADTAPLKIKRSIRLKVKSFSSFRDRSASPPHDTKNQTKTSVTPTQQIASVNPYSSDWCPSTVAALKPPLGIVSSSKASTGLDLLQPANYSPAPNLILQPSPVIDESPRFVSGKRSRTFSTAHRHQSSSESTLTAKNCVTIIGSQ
ncbi:hypothetical protein BGX26_007020, partial [Mortierella sp. AD094]